MRSGVWFLAVCAFATLVLCSTAHQAVGAPLCSYGTLHPDYPALNAAPTTRAGSTPPKGADCFDDPSRPATWITVAAVLQSSLSTEEILERFGAVSALKEVQYWSVRDKTWRPMVSTAFAVSSIDAEQPTGDYTPAELGRSSHFYRVTDTQTYAPINYSMELHRGAGAQIVVETSNVDPIKKWGITLYAAGGLRTLYLLNERTPGVWSYYSITRAVPATFLARGHEESYINRATALYRHYMQLPTATVEP